MKLIPSAFIVIGLTAPLSCVYADDATAPRGNTSLSFYADSSAGINGRVATSDTTAYVFGVSGRYRARDTSPDSVTPNDIGFGEAISRSDNDTSIVVRAGYRQYRRGGAVDFFLNYGLYIAVGENEYKTTDIDETGTVTSRYTGRSTTRDLGVILGLGVEYFLARSVSIEGQAGVSASYGDVVEKYSYYQAVSGTYTGKSSGPTSQLGTFSSAVALNVYW